MSKPLRIQWLGRNAIILVDGTSDAEGGFIPFSNVEIYNLNYSFWQPGVDYFSSGLRTGSNGTTQNSSPFVFRNMATNLRLRIAGDLPETLTILVKGVDVYGFRLEEEVVLEEPDLDYFTQYQYQQVDYLEADTPYEELTISSGNNFRTAFIRCDNNRKSWNAALQLYANVTNLVNVYGTVAEIPTYPSPGNVSIESNLTATLDAFVPKSLIVTGPSATDVATYVSLPSPYFAIWAESSDDDVPVDNIFDITFLQQGIRA